MSMATGSWGNKAVFTATKHALLWSFRENCPWKILLNASHLPKAEVIAFQNDNQDQAK